MYTAEDRANLLAGITAYLENEPEFEGLLLMGSGAEGFTDLYSDIDMMAGCFSADDLSLAAQKLQNYFQREGQCLIHHRAWTDTVLGMSVYYQNGLSVDISFMPTAELPIHSKAIRILFSKTALFESSAAAPATMPTAVIDSYSFFLELRYTAIALRRRDLIFADLALNRARKIVLDQQATQESKKRHQFKAYHTLSRSFLDSLEETYPKERTISAYQSAAKKLLTLYQFQQPEPIPKEMWYMLEFFDDNIT